ncbi:SPX domain-containing protein [Mycena sanguinolenta]|uniref:SPX domain-containing protein n=1 Tax=Mycena sanguinolenta TaxID=230812 RepID=A0A8H7DJS7_9AGAR|nr:SPX domain-containing protein [Mycena sanguinolenta]
MSPPAPVYTVFRRRSLRRPALIFVVLLVIFFLGQFMREMGFDAQHSTRIAFKYAGAGMGRAKETITRTRTLWATRTLTRTAGAVPTREAKQGFKKVKANPKANSKQEKGKEEDQHTFHPLRPAPRQPPRSTPHSPPHLPRRIRLGAKALPRLTHFTRSAWWAYAKVHGVMLPDEYDAIERDLGPFWGVEPSVLREVQRRWEGHVDSYTIGVEVGEDDSSSDPNFDVEDSFGGGSGMTRKRQLAMLNFTLPADERVRLELAAGGFQIIDMLREAPGVEEALTEVGLGEWRAVFSPHDNPNLVLDHELREMALEAARKGTYIDPLHPPPEKHGWRAACPPFSPAWLDDTPFPDYEREPREGWPSVPGEEQDGPKTFIHDPFAAMDPCLHPADLRTHGAYLAHGAGPGPQRALVPQFSYSVTPLHADIRVALPINWVSGLFPTTSHTKAAPPPLGLSWAERVDARLQWRGSNTGIWHAADGRWRDAHRIRLAALAAGVGSVNVSVLNPGAPFDEAFDAFGKGGGGSGRGFRAQGGEGSDTLGFGFDDDEDWDDEEGDRGRRAPVGAPISVPRARLVPALFDVAFAGRPLNCEGAQCAVLEGMFEWRKAHDLKTAARYKYVLDVDGNGWSSRFKRLMNSGSLIFKATTYPEWFTDRLAPWVHYVPIQNSYSDLLDGLVFFRAHDKAAERIAAAGREWSRRFWRKEDMVAYMYRLFLEYARVMSLDRDAMSFEMWPDEREDAARERALMVRWERKMEAKEEEEE